MDFKHFDDKINESQLIQKYDEFAQGGLFTPVQQSGDIMVVLTVN